MAPLSSRVLFMLFLCAPIILPLYCAAKPVRPSWLDLGRPLTSEPIRSAFIKSLAFFDLVTLCCCAAC